MSAENSGKTHEPYGLSGRAFQFTYDDLICNREGYLSLSQQFRFNFLERRLYSWLLRFPPIKWTKPRKVIKTTGKIKSKDYSFRLLNASGGSGKGNNYQVVREKRHIQFLTDDEDGLGFYVTEKQYNSLPQNIEMTLYYDPDKNRIISVEPPYDKD